MPDTDLPIARPILDEAAEELVLEVLRSGRLTQGPMVERFEQKVAEAAGTDWAIAVTSGTTALVAALEALELEPGDEVLTSPFTFAATLNAILEAGATARFVDIGDDFNIDPDAFGDGVGPRTRVVMPVHLYGLPADMERIEPVARSAGAVIIEDAAQSIGSSVGNRMTGSYGLGAFSFYATKNVTTGEGGAVTTSDKTIADRLRVLRNQGMRGRYNYVAPGHNYRMTELQAAVGIPQMERLEEISAMRRSNARRLIEGLKDLPDVEVPNVPEGRTHVFNQFTLRVKDTAPVSRETLAERLRIRGIATGLYYPRLVFEYDCYRSNPRVIATDVPQAARTAREVLSLPVHPALTEDDIDRIVEGVRSGITA